MTALFNYFFGSYNLPRHSRLFKICIYLFILLKCFYWLFNYSLLFGDHSIVYRAAGHTNFIKDLAYVLYNNKSNTLALTFIVLAIALCSLMLWRRRNNQLADFALWLLVINLHYSIYPTLTGGDYLLNQLLFFNIFIAVDTRADRGKERDLMVCLHNAAVLGVMLQVCLLYFVAGLAKVFDHDWLNGSAVEKILLVDHFSLFQAPSAHYSMFYRFMNWLVLGYQLLFPLLVWLRRVKIPLLLSGVLMHLYIAVVLGLPAFGLIMILSYIYFWPTKRPAV